MTTAYPYGATIVSETLTGVTSPVPTFGGLVAAKDYLNASSSPGADAFAALADDNARKKRLVDAKRFLDSLGWRSIDDADAAEAAVDMLNASYEMAGLIAADNEATAAADAGNNVAELTAKGVGIKYFRPTSLAAGTATQLPTVIQRLVGKYLATSDPSVAAAAAGMSNGTTENSHFENCDALGLARPF